MVYREPEMVRAYRDTWELGIHSWLTYIRDRLLLAREMLTDSGSCFVQVFDENVHLVRCVMDEVFGRENFVRQIAFRKTSALAFGELPRVHDVLIWYSNRKETLKYRNLFVKTPPDSSWFSYAEIGKKIMPIKELTTEDTSSGQARYFSLSDLKSSGYAASCTYDFEFAGRTIKAQNKSWRTHEKGIKNLIKANRLFDTGNIPRYKQYHDDFPVQPLDNLWNDTVAVSELLYVVQTQPKVIQRCLLMTTDPGDLVLDPTCGSGTTAYVAEQWGRRWITTDVSRVPLALARQRLLTATYPHYQLKDEKRGPAGGFVYKRKQNKKGEEIGGIVPHITLKSIANNEPHAEEVLIDKPETESNVVRITGPFCVEAVLPTPLSPEADTLELKDPGPWSDDEDNHVERMIEVLRLSPVLKLQGNQEFKLDKVRPPAKSLGLHAEAENDGGAVTIVFGPANGPISERVVIEAGKEARAKAYRMLFVIAFAIEPAARETVEHGEATFGLPAFYAQASTDLVVADLLKNTHSSQIFAVVGMPDVKLEKAAEKADDGGDLWQVTLRGLDVFDPARMKHDALQGDDVPCWMLDTDYDGQCFRAGQVFFPRTSAWDKIRYTVQADFDESIWERLRGAVSTPFVAGEQIAVKVLDDRGNELMVVKKIGDAK